MQALLSRVPTVGVLFLLACGGAGPGTNDPFNNGSADGGWSADGGPTGPSCTPRTCQQLGRSCGTTDDGCGAVLTCGKCDNDPLNRWFNVPWDSPVPVTGSVMVQSDYPGDNDAKTVRFVSSKAGGYQLELPMSAVGNVAGELPADVYSVRYQANAHPSHPLYVTHVTPTFNFQAPAGTFSLNVPLSSATVSGTVAFPGGSPSADPTCTVYLFFRPVDGSRLTGVGTTRATCASASGNLLPFTVSLPPGTYSVEGSYSGNGPFIPYAFPVATSVTVNAGATTTVAWSFSVAAAVTVTGNLHFARPLSCAESYELVFESDRIANPNIQYTGYLNYPSDCTAVQTVKFTAKIPSGNFRAYVQFHELKQQVLGTTATTGTSMTMNLEAPDLRIVGVSGRLTLGGKFPEDIPCPKLHDATLKFVRQGADTDTRFTPVEVGVSCENELYWAARLAPGTYDVYLSGPLPYYPTGDVHPHRLTRLNVSEPTANILLDYPLHTFRRVSGHITRGAQTLACAKADDWVELTWNHTTQPERSFRTRSYCPDGYAIDVLVPLGPYRVELQGAPGRWPVEKWVVEPGLIVAP